MIKQLYYILAISAMLILLMYYGKFVISPLLYGIFFAILLMPLINFFVKYIKVYTLSFLMAIGSVFMLIGIPIALFYSQVRQFAFAESFNEFSAEKITNYVAKNFGKLPLVSNIELADLESSLLNLGQAVLTYLQSLIQSGGNFIFTIGLALIFSFYMGIFYPKINEAINAYLSDKERLKWKEISNKAPKVVRAYVSGLMLVIFILAILNSIAFLLIGLQNAPLWGVFVSLFSIIPYVGPLIACIIVITYSAVTSGTTFQPLLILLCSGIIQQLEGNFITPKIVGEKINVNPLFIILLVLFFGKIWGIEGIIICLPLAGVVKTIIDKYKEDNILSKIIEPMNS